MDEDRKYRQRGYMDSNRESNGHRREDRAKPQGPRPPIDITGPRLPRLVQHVAAARCFNCSTALPEGLDWNSNCPKCGTALHCCKQCTHFEPSTRFQCVKPIPVRIPGKDVMNDCPLFKPRVTIARDAAPGGSNSGVSAAAAQAAPRTPNDARTAFDNLFKK
jgi:hypothetical protein